MAALAGEAVQQCCQDIGCPPSQAIAIGDGANDLGMLTTAGLGVAYCAKPLTATQADAVIAFPRLDAAVPLTLLS